MQINTFHIQTSNPSAMKKFLLLLFAPFILFNTSRAQVCTLDTFTVPGIYPDTIVNLPAGYGGAAYGTVIQVRVLTDTVSSGLNVHVDDIEINNVAGLPPGFSYACFPSTCKFPGGGNGCIYLSGSPTLAQAGTYSLTVNVTLHGKILGTIPVSQSSQILGYKIKIQGAPVADFTSTNSSVCQGELITYTDLSTNQPLSWSWLFPGGTPSASTLQNPVVTYNTGGTFNVSLTATNPAGNTILTKMAYVTIKTKPAASISPSGAATICSGTSATITANSGSGFSYQWIKNGSDIGGATGILYQASASGTYKVRVTKANGCFKESAGKSITVSNVQAVITPAGNTTFCSGGNVLLSVNTGTGLSYQWRKNGVNIGGAVGSTYAAAATGTYKVIVTNQNGCTKLSPAGISVTVNSLPAAAISANGPLTFCAGGSVVLSTGAGNYSYQWKRNGTNINGATLVSYTATTAGSYKVIVTNNQGCSKTSATKTVVINCRTGDKPEENSRLFPNPGNGNAILRLTMHEEGLVRMVVFDSQGRKVYETTDEIRGIGEHEIPLSMGHLPYGLYLLKISTPAGDETIRMMIDGSQNK
jgi:PKD repeat protein